MGMAASGTKCARAECNFKAHEKQDHGYCCYGCKNGAGCGGACAGVAMPESAGEKRKGEGKGKGPKGGYASMVLDDGQDAKAPWAAKRANPGKASPGGQKYYVDPDGGNDENAGTEEGKAFKSLDPINTMTLAAGDEVLFKAGSRTTGSLKPHGSGKPDAPIKIGMYGKGKKPIIDGAGYLSAIHLQGESHYEFNSLFVTADAGDPVEEAAAADRYGIVIDGPKDGEATGIVFKDLDISDIYATNASPPKKDHGKNETSHEGSAILINTRSIKGDSKISNFLMEGCTVRNTGRIAFQLSGPFGKPAGTICDVQVLNCIFEDVGGSGIVAGLVHNMEVKGCKFNNSGAYKDPRMFGRGSGMWPFKCVNVLVENNKFLNAYGNADSAGCHIDIGNTNVVIQHNLMVNNMGGFVHMFGGNTNCTYRYNISINDGSRIKGEDGGHEPGRVMGATSAISNATLKSDFNRNNYIYNNTIFVKKDQRAGFGLTKMMDGMVLANNIIHIEGESYNTRGPFQETKVDDPDAKPARIVCKHNLFIRDGVFPEGSHYTDETGIIGDPNFLEAGSLDPAKYVPQNKDIVKGKGMKIEHLTGDKIGTFKGLKVETDFFGNKVDHDSPCIGAIQV